MDDATPSKTCTGCGETKPLTDFGIDRQKKDGRAFRCKPCKAAQRSIYAQTPAGKQSLRERQRRFNEAHPDRRAEWMRAWREAHPGYSAEANRAWREQNPGAAAAYHQANRDKAMARLLRRRKRLAEAAFGVVDLSALWATQGTVCPLCSEPIDAGLPYPHPLSPSVDHIVPLSKGGRHCQDNLQWTHLRCNIRKGARPPT